MSETPTSVWKVLVVEDDARTRRYFAQCVQACPQLALLDCLGTLAAARAWLASTPAVPDVLLTDLGLPDGSGIDVIKETLARFPRCEPLVVSMFADDEHLLASIEAGALGYVHKDSAPANVAETILELKAGASPISPGLARRLLMRYRQPEQAAAVPAQPVAAKQEAANGPKPNLSGREAEILDLLARGFSYAEIASLCGLSRHTVASHVKSLYRKMQVGSRSEAVFEALQSGVIQPLSSRG